MLLWLAEPVLTEMSSCEMGCSVGVIFEGEMSRGWSRLSPRRWPIILWLLERCIPVGCAVADAGALRSWPTSLFGVEFCRRCERRRVSMAEVGFDSMMPFLSSKCPLVVESGWWLSSCGGGFGSATHAAQAAFAGLNQVPVSFCSSNLSQIRCPLWGCCYERVELVVKRRKEISECDEALR
jgi:hypothetical protein